MKTLTDMYAQPRDSGFNAIQDLAPTQKAILLVGVLVLVGMISSVISGARSWNRPGHFDGPFSAAFTANVPLTQHLLSWSFIFDTLAYSLAREIYTFNA
jgi:hypothetical protein